MNLHLLPCSYAPREARAIAGHKECWLEVETRTLSQLVEAACPDRRWHAPMSTSIRCRSCGLYLIREVVAQ